MLHYQSIQYIHIVSHCSVLNITILELGMVQIQTDTACLQSMVLMMGATHACHLSCIFLIFILSENSQLFYSTVIINTDPEILQKSVLIA